MSIGRKGERMNIEYRVEGGKDIGPDGKLTEVGE